MSHIIVISDEDQNKMKFLAEKIAKALSGKETSYEILKSVQRDNDEILNILDKYHIG
jgi:hypothetical protein